MRVTRVLHDVQMVPGGHLCATCALLFDGPAISIAHRDAAAFAVPYRSHEVCVAMGGRVEEKRVSEVVHWHGLGSHRLERCKAQARD